MGHARAPRAAGLGGTAAAVADARAVTCALEAAWIPLLFHGPGMASSYRSLLTLQSFWAPACRRYTVS